MLPVNEEKRYLLSFLNMVEEDYEQMNKFEGEYWWHVGRRIILGRLIGKYAASFKNDLSILDVGCGTGGNFGVLEKFGNVIGADSSDFALQFCRRQNKNVKLVSGNVLPFPDGSFDIVTLFDVLEHIEKEEEMINECRKVLKQGGKAVITVPAYESIWSRHDEIMGHHRRYRKKMLREKFEKAGFRTVKISYCITSMFPVIFIVRLLSRIFPPQKNGRKTYSKTSGPLNRILIELLRAESFLLEAVDLPFGCSVAAVFEKEQETSAG